MIASIKIRSLGLMLLVSPATITLPVFRDMMQTHDLVSGNLIQFNNNGIRTWYSDE
jgi:hypothetical protein